MRVMSRSIGMLGNSSLVLQLLGKDDGVIIVTPGGEFEKSLDLERLPCTLFVTIVIVSVVGRAPDSRTSSPRRAFTNVDLPAEKIYFLVDLKVNK